MKNIFILIMMLSVSLNIFGKDNGKSIFPIKDGNVVYEEVIQQEGDKLALFTKARKFFTDTFKDSKSVIEQESVESGIIIGKGTIPFNIYQVHFTISMHLKDNRYKYIIDNIYMQMPKTPLAQSSKDTPLQKWSWVYKNEKRSTELNNKFKDITELIKQSMASSVSGDDDW